MGHQYDGILHDTSLSEKSRNMKQQVYYNSISVITKCTNIFIEK